MFNKGFLSKFGVHLPHKHIIQLMPYASTGVEGGHVLLNIGIPNHGKEARNRHWVTLDQISQKMEAGNRKVTEHRLRASCCKVRGNDFKTTGQRHLGERMTS